ncbi:FAD/NAD(P)-binding domain-containing protein [Dendrothele bispora CBS 962.96]|uniref:FAD/NAD(P)-binding domain-containing protein n=1 Tax=Dendrothele bispora (strain CBS 962.96) TaxID=1314807 RepID=A0A4S8KQT8_DENBC|nr:FAD/NAD(P)-binding domain-containing protein [Dendrothele bispora CBS 962.96]
MFATQTQVVLDFCVVGGSIGGLCAAYWLRQAGHKVAVLERHEIDVFQNRKFCGVRIPPNITRLFKDIPGMEEMFEDKGSLNLGTLFYQGETSELVGRMLFEEEMMADLGSKFYRVSYSDIWNHLYKTCRSYDINFKFNCRVESITLKASNEPNHSPRLRCSTGEEVICDMIIAADGHNSTVRKYFLNDLLSIQDSDSDIERDEVSHFPELSQWATCRLSIPIEEMKKDPELRFFAKNNLWIVWMGNGVVHNGGQDGSDQYSISTMYNKRPSSDEDKDWDIVTPTPLSTKEIEETVCEPRLKKLLKLASSCHRSNQKPYKLVRYINQTYQVVFIGDAAHAAVVNGPQNTAIAVEDAFTLGYLFSKMVSRDHISLLLKGFNEIRQKRANMIRTSDFEFLHILCFPPGPERDARNAAFSQTLQKETIPDEVLAQMWDAFLVQCNYDAQHAVEEWWHTWGRLMQIVENTV